MAGGRKEGESSFNVCLTVSGRVEFEENLPAGPCKVARFMSSCL